MSERTVDDALARAEQLRLLTDRAEHDEHEYDKDDLVLLANEVLRLRTAHLHSEDQLRAKCDEIVALLDEVQRLRAEPPKCSGCGSTEVAPLCDYCHLGY